MLPVSEPRARALAAQLYQLPALPGPAEFSALAEAWKPFRTWSVVLIRAAARRVLGAEPAHPAAAAS